MPDIKGLMSKKVFGIPAPIVALAGGVAVWYLFLRGKGSTSSSSSSGVSPSGTAFYQCPPGTVQQSDGSCAPNQAPTPPSPTAPPCTPGGPTGYLCGGPPLTSKPCPPGTFGPGQPYCTAGSGGGIGGRSSGSRSSSWSGNYFHPSITRRVVYTHYVKAIGGPSMHSAEIKRVGGASGVHEARLRVLNPVYTGKIRIA